MIASEETEIIGRWIKVNGGIDGDAACKRVHHLVDTYLTKLGYSPESGGWDTLYEDPSDNRYWERVYLESHMHGGGPPSLISLSEERAREKYSNLFDL